MKKRIKFLMFCLLSLPKTIWFNFKCLPFKIAMRLPILVGFNIRVLKAKKNVVCFGTSFEPKLFTVRFGFGGTRIIRQSKGMLNISEGRVVFNNNNCFAAGIVLDVNKGNLYFGKDFSCNKNCFISCSHKIELHNKIMLGWNVTIRDSDGHQVFHDKKPVEHQKEVVVFDHVWLCSHSTLLKGSSIASGSIVGYGSLVTKSFQEANVLIAGVPGKIMKRSISWDHIDAEVNVE